MLHGKEKNVISCFLISFNTSQVEFFLLIVFLIFWPIICSTLNKWCLEIWFYTWLWLLGIWFIFLCSRSLWNISDKFVFLVTWSPELVSQSFPVSCVWPCGFAPHWKWNFMFLVHQNMRKENCYLIYIISAILISTLWRFYRANKKNLSYSL